MLLALLDRFGVKYLWAREIGRRCFTADAAFLRLHGGTFHVLNSPIQEIEATARGFPNARAGEPSPNVRFDPRKHYKALTSSAKVSELKKRCYNKF
jgi:hypothetical protein